MADIILSRPQTGQSTVLSSTPGAHLKLQFPTDEATMDRSGDSLVFSFSGGGRIELSDFYTQHTKENVPSFEVGGSLVAGSDFFSAFGPDLMPAAGPGTAVRGGRYNDFAASDLTEGLNHLDGLDYSTEFAATAVDTLNVPGAAAAPDLVAVAAGQPAAATPTPEVSQPAPTPPAATQPEVTPPARAYNGTISIELPDSVLEGESITVTVRVDIPPPGRSAHHPQ